jgi:hypothetical protein
MHIAVTYNFYRQDQVQLTTDEDNGRTGNPPGTKYVIAKGRCPSKGR